MKFQQRLLSHYVHWKDGLIQVTVQMLHLTGPKSLFSCRTPLPVPLVCRDEESGEGRCLTGARQQGGHRAAQGAFQGDTSEQGCRKEWEDSWELSADSPAPAEPAGWREVTLAWEGQLGREAGCPRTHTPVCAYSNTKLVNPFLKAGLI